MDERTKLDKEVVCKNMEKKLSKKRKKTAGEYTINEGDHPVVIEEQQNKKIKTDKILSKKNKGTDGAEYEANGDNPDLAKSNLADSSLVKSNVDDDQGKNMKKKKTSKESKHKEYSESKNNECEDDDQGKKMRKKKLTKESKLKEHNDIVEKMKTDGGDPYLAKSNVVDQPLVQNNDDQHLVKINEGEDDGQGKKMKKKKNKFNEESKQWDYREFKSNECVDEDKDKKMKKKKLSHKSKSKENCELKSNEFEDEDHGRKMKKKKKKLAEVDNQGNMMKKKKKKKLAEEDDDDNQGNVMKKKKKLSHKSNSKENCEFNSNKSDPPLASVTEVIDQGKKVKKKKKVEAVTGEFPNPASDGASKPKRVTFSDQVEVCCDGLVRGKRFTPEEDEKIKAAVYHYIESHGLGDDGLDMILNCQKYPHVRGCWLEIREALPNRPPHYVYQRAHVLFESIKCKWTQEELDFIKKFHEQHGSDWKSIGEALGKSRNQVKDAWRRLKFSNLNKGHWSQEEYQTLFDLVNLDLRMRAKEKYRKTNHGMLRDNICWEAIAHKLSTRSSSWCCKKWYEQLVSPLVANGEWCDSDDYRMLDALYTLDACNMEEVDWDNLVEGRSGDVCRKRWGQMVHHIGEHVGKSFSEQVEVLSKRFCPDLLEAREAFDAKPVICN